MTRSKVLEWLLEEDQPAIRFLTLTELLGRPRTDPDVRRTQEQIPRTGWAAEIFARQNRHGLWDPEDRLYHGKYLSTNWMLLILSDLGLTRADPRIATACKAWIERFAKKDGGFSMDGASQGHLCITGNTARALLRFGYARHPRVRSAFAWLAEHRSKLGGWSCYGSGRNLDSWEGLSAFAELPRAAWSEEFRSSATSGAEFFLSRELHHQGERYAPWFRFHYPVHYYYDLLVGLDILTRLGYASDPRLTFALGVLREKRRRDGRWNLDSVHPDVEGPIAEWLARHPNDRPVPFALEKAGAPSKMITLTALRVLNRLEPAS
ncbi:MAG: hypothetical protein L3J93_06680 [Thermoplasmata archaeon]|nr:hypothetical protein [Thermoplasmata archaeon]